MPKIDPIQLEREIVSLSVSASAKLTNLSGTTDTIEKSVQTLFEDNLEALLGVRFLASEFTPSNSGRNDTLGLDENSCPYCATI
jgi:hypothetical protein